MAGSPSTRWCSDRLEIVCDNGEKVRVAFALDCCDREAMGIGDDAPKMSRTSWSPPSSIATAG